MHQSKHRRMAQSILLFVLLATLVATLSGFRREKIAPYSEAEEAGFRREQASQLADPRGDLAFVRSVILDESVWTLGTASSNRIVLPHWQTARLTLRKHGEVVRLDGDSKGTMLDGKPVAAGVEVPFSQGEVNHWICSGSIAIRLVKNERGLEAQIFDGRSALLQKLHAQSWFKPASRYRVAARWVPLPPGHLMVLHRTNGGSDFKDNAAGYIEFSMDGRPMRLYAMVFGQQIFIAFRDLTSKTESYPSGRFLRISFPSSAFDSTRKFDPAMQAEMALDFNQAVNPACAYNPKTKCPIAPPENRLSLAIPAGEKRYDREK